MRRRTFISASLGLGMLGALAAPVLRAAPAAPGTMSRSDIPGTGLAAYSGAGLAFGTTVSVTLLHDIPKQAERAIEDALGQVRHVDALMSLYRENSQVAILNRQGFLDKPHPLLLTVLRQSQQLAARTDGAFDITVQPLWMAHAGASREGTPLPLLDLHAARGRVDWRKLSVSDRQIVLREEGMAITLNGIAQGFASDLALAALKARNIRHALLDTGEFASVGRPSPQRPWMLGVRDPRNETALLATLPLENRSMATSGDYEAAFTPDFSSHHIVDPATGVSPQELASVSVTAPSGMLADGMSTALLVMGPAKALFLCAAMPGVDALMVGKSGRIWKSAGMMDAARKTES
jgi:thiamine biosynthesis lipoprotein